MRDKINNFYELDAWKKGHELVLAIYRSTKSFPKDELYGVVSQLRRAVSSITANIAEGFARFHFKDKVRFYYQARGSIAEVQNFLFLARDLEYITKEQDKELREQADDVSRLINGLIRSIEIQHNNNP
jgi:four helix bundle protein